MKRKLVLLFVVWLVVAGTLKADDSNQPDSMKFVATDEGRFAEAKIQTGLPESFGHGSVEATEDASQFFWFQYGDESSRAVCIKFDPDEPGQIFIDTNRNQKFTKNERFESTEEGIWFVDLKVEYGPQQGETSEQRVRVRRDNDSSDWFVATAGYRMGKADFDGDLRDAKLEDKNANGMWFDREDRLFVDFDGNGKISRLTERIPAQGMRKIRGTLYAISGRAAGGQVSFSEVNGSGFLDPAIQLFEEGSTISSVKGMLGSNTGVGIQIESLDKPIEVPPGDWYVENLQIEVKGEQGTFKFAFARSGNKKLVSVADGETHELELLGELSLESEVSVQKENEKAHLTLMPMLTTESGCFLVSSRMGKNSANDENRLMAYSSSPLGDLETGSSGFS
jgi:hypothetical protein